MLNGKGMEAGPRRFRRLSGPSKNSVFIGMRSKVGALSKRSY